MSVETMALALHHSAASGTAKVVLLGIANHDGDGGSWPSHSTLAKYANVSERNVRRAIDTLVELGEIRVHKNEGGTRKTAEHLRPNLYEVLIHCPADCDGSRDHRPVPTEVDRGAVAPPVVDNSTNTRSERGRQRPLGEGGSAPSRGAVAPPEPSKNHPGTRGEGSSLTSRAAVDNSRSSPLEDLGGHRPDPVPLTRPDRCAAHQLADIVPPCGACKDARVGEERRQVLALAEVRAAAERRERAPACPEHPGGRVGWCSGCAADHKAGDHRQEPSVVCHLCVAASSEAVS